jgi:hypothetical protein
MLCPAPCRNGSPKMKPKPSSSGTKDGPRPERFPLGSPESRAAARSVLNSRSESEKLVLRFEFIGFPGCWVQFVVDEWGTRKTGREPTLEEMAGHPALQNCGGAPSPSGEGALPQAEPKPYTDPEQEQPIISQSGPRYDPLAAVNRRRC